MQGELCCAGMSEELGLCGLCGRVMIAGPSVNQHHLIPRSHGGREAVPIHRVCHTKIHSVFTERQLLREYNTFEKLLTHDEIIKFVAWIRKKPPELYTRNRRSKNKGR